MNVDRVLEEEASLMMVKLPIVEGTAECLLIVIGIPGFGAVAEPELKEM
jgi:hypothetical protein